MALRISKTPLLHRLKKSCKVVNCFGGRLYDFYLTVTKVFTSMGKLYTIKIISRYGVATVLFLESSVSKILLPILLFQKKHSENQLSSLLKKFRSPLFSSPPF